MLCVFSFKLRTMSIYVFLLFCQIIQTAFILYPMFILTCKSCENGKTDRRFVSLNVCHSKFAETLKFYFCQCNFYFQEIKSCK